MSGECYEESEFLQMRTTEKAKKFDGSFWAKQKLASEGNRGANCSVRQLQTVSKIQIPDPST